ncbi:hypothetical protein C0Q70_01975 [Pomacea canaliculata]|uniref:Uncharacterized protein n=1 Tax=Pomacea canaliculata TaxID=400727 RepID=A0A2T7Q0Y6_POMCA|nr:uncharacterized protein LOC112556362 [Pomacea canaliculata]PVD39345.1 hypothetical protein C0Q70_01975 [Pomacea canaliculata]
MATGNEKTNDAGGPSAGGLEEFIANQQAIQRAQASNEPGENIDDGKLSQFLSRAFSESRRMNNEVEKSRAKSEKMHQILGAERVSSWCKEHAAEVLTQQQQDLVEGTSKP